MPHSHTVASRYKLGPSLSPALTTKPPFCQPRLAALGAARYCFGMEWTVTDIVIICLGLGLGAFVKGAIGFGLPMIATPIMLFGMPLPEVVALMLAPVFVTNIQQCWLTRTEWRRLSQFWPMIVACWIVIIPGSQLLVRLNAEMLAGFVGALILFHALVEMVPAALKQGRFAWLPQPQKLIIPAGLLSGVSGSLTSIYSFPTLQLMVSMRLAKDGFVFVIGVFLLSGYFGLWSGLAMAGFPSPAIALNGLWVVIPAIIGLLTGNAIRKHVAAATFARLVNVALAIAGTALIGKAII